MTINEARLIREIKKRCTYRRLAEIYYPEDDPGHSNQGYGEDLCKEALETLYPDKNYWCSPPKFTEPYECLYFNEENFSKINDHYWWE